MTSRPEKILLPVTDSTNAEMRRMISAGRGAHGLAVCAIEQTAGRGQRGNSWESEPGANVTLSLMLAPANIEARRQFLMSMAVSLGIVGAIGEYTDPQVIKIKWPNDIYIGESKVCGILIENTLCGQMIGSSIVGIGLNVNQRSFLSDAPNPVSMARTCGMDLDVREVEDKVIDCVMAEVDRLDTALAHTDGRYADALKKRYMSSLWRRQGEHRFIDTSRAEEFVGRIADVALDGTITLIDTAERPRHFLFKEVTFIL